MKTKFTKLEILLVILSLLFLYEWRISKNELTVLQGGDIQKAIETKQFDDTVKSDSIKN